MPPKATDEIDVRLISSCLGLGGRHGHAAWEVVGPLYLSEEMPTATVSVLEVLVDSIHQLGYGPESDNMMRTAAVYAGQRYEELLEIGVPEERARLVFPRTVRARMLVSMIYADLVNHLLGTDKHSEAVQTVDHGMYLTLTEDAPTAAAELSIHLPKGVFGPTCEQKE